MCPDQNREDSLRRLLRAGDPVGDGCELSPDEASELRRVMLRSVRTSRPTRWIPLGAAVAAALLAAIVLLPGSTTGPDPSRVVSQPKAERTLPEESAEGKRQIQFATDSGTQIIWVLDPNLDL
jgi:hypothetical protein